MSTKPKNPFSLTVLEGDRKNFDFHLESKHFSIGREKCDITIKNSSVSRRHVLIEIKEESVIVKDLQSKNGTYVNGKKVLESKLQDGDVLTIGTVKMVFRDKRNAGTQTGLPVFTPEELNGKAGVAPPIPGQEQTQEEVDAPEPKVELEVPESYLELMEYDEEDIVFDDSNFKSANLEKTLQWNARKEDYIDFDDLYEDFKPQNILKKSSEGNSLEVTVSIGGHIISRDYLPIKNTTYYVHGKKGESTHSCPARFQ